MTSLFDQIELASQQAITATFGARPVRDFPATFARAPKVAAPDYVRTDRNGAEASLGPSELWIDRETVAAIGYEPRRGDKIEFISGSGQTFVVAAVEPGDSGDLRIMLTS